MTKLGDQLDQADCVVISQAAATPTFGPSQFKTVKDKTVLLSLDCNAVLASATDAGNSAASPQGQKAKKDHKTA